MEPLDYDKILEDLSKIPSMSEFVKQYQTYSSDYDIKTFKTTMHVSNPIYWKLKSLIEHIEQEFASNSIFVYKRSDLHEDWLSKDMMISKIESCMNLAKFDETYKLPAHAASLCNQWVKATGFVYNKWSGLLT